MEVFQDKTILLVEDDLISLKFLNLLFKKYQFKVLSAVNAFQAMDLLEQNHVDIVLLDVQLPSVNGIEIAKKIRLKNTKIPIIAQSAGDLNELKQECINAGCNDYISKPINRKELIDKIKNYVKACD